MKLSLRSLTLLPCLAAFMAMTGLSPAAHADPFSVNGSVWEVGTFSTVPATGDPAYSMTPTATFTVSNTAANNLFNFDSRNGAGDYTLSGFLTSGGDGLVYSTGASHGGDLLNQPLGCGGSACTTNDLFQFKGSTTLTPGSYSTDHDDGLRLYLNGVDVFNGTEAGPTAPTSTPFKVCAMAGSGCNALAGTYSFELDYGEVSGPPAVLKTDLPLTSTPEPGSFILLGTGLLAAAGVVRRRMSL